ncbi:hypothetical protein C1645_826279 [Glomus cerebriforme]|uniref:Uncharacterized protein n=1 Tax=Glomus cerebriforme TaxID=658196 RepID=A0A397SR62_9GLOM|nr:hypothetical protein C1645_826279 [Glomus cerebriforme]
MTPQRREMRSRNDKQPSKKKLLSLLVRISNFVDHKIKLEDGFYVKVMAVKMIKSDVFLEVEKK